MEHFILCSTIYFNFTFYYMVSQYEKLHTKIMQNEHHDLSLLFIPGGQIQYHELYTSGGEHCSRWLKGWSASADCLLLHSGCFLEKAKENNTSCCFHAILYQKLRFFYLFLLEEFLFVTTFTEHRHFHAAKLNPHLAPYTNLHITDVNYRIRELLKLQVGFFKTEHVIFSR